MAKIAIDDTFDIVTIIRDKLDIIDPKGNIVTYEQFKTFTVGQVMEIIYTGTWKYERQLSNNINAER